MYGARKGILSPQGLAYRTEVLADNPHVYYSLDESSGTTAVDLGSAGINATYSGTRTQGEPSLDDGGDGAVLITAGKVQTNSLVMPIGSGAAFSIEFILKYTQTGSRVGFSIHDAPANQISIEFNRDENNSTDNGNFHLKTFDGAIGRLAPVTNPNVNDGSPHHIVITRTGTTGQIFVDGLSLTVAGSVRGGVVWTNFKAAKIGQNVTGSFMIGTFDEWAIYHSVLGADRVLAHAQAGGFA
jgi:hypothetical protein